MEADKESPLAFEISRARPNGPSGRHRQRADGL